MRSLIRSSIVALSIFAFPVFAVAATTVPNTFTAGTPAKAADVNANFQALATAIDNLSARVDKLDGTTQVTAADLAGTYTISGIATQFSVTTGVSSYISAMSAGGTITLNSDGTGSINMSVQGNQLALPIDPTAATTTSSPIPNQTGNFTWSLSGNKGTVSNGAVFVVIPGAKSIVLTRHSPQEALEFFMVLTRN